jgi:hypothetical protein
VRENLNVFVRENLNVFERENFNVFESENLNVYVRENLNVFATKMSDELEPREKSFWASGDFERHSSNITASTGCIA